VESSTLRWVLIIVGLVILGLIFIFGNPEKKRKPRASRRESVRRRGAVDSAARREPTVGPSTADSEKGDETEAGNQGELEIGATRPEGQPRMTIRPPVPEPEQIVSLFLMAQDNHVITGAQLLEAAVKTGMDFGDMNIFHRSTEGDSRPVFSLANASKPGNFDRSTWHEFETGALVLFTTLPNPMPALDAWDSMLATAKRMAEILDGELQDEDHHPFSRQREAQIREEMRDYDRKRKVRRD
jgi:cell division protein ZipA